MTSVTGDANSISKYMRNCQEMGIQVLPPDVNESDKKFSVTDGKIPVSYTHLDVYKRQDPVRKSSDDL